MKIILIGHGQMGKAVEQEALLQGHSVVAYYDLQNRPFIQEKDLPDADVCIEFTYPEAALENCTYALDLGYPVVSGTTGWETGVEELRARANRENLSFFHASNYSIGVNILYSLNKKLAELMNQTDGYIPKIEEVHHIYKKDAPSGTAIHLAKALVEKSKYVQNWTCLRSDTSNEVDIEDPTMLKVYSERKGDVPGIHEVSYQSSVDKISIRHEAFNRQGLAIGVLLAAKYATEHKGALTMDMLLGLD